MRLALEQIVEYELRAAPWVGWVSIGWMQEVVAWYFIRKAKRKYASYIVSLDEQARVKARAAILGSKP